MRVRRASRYLLVTKQCLIRMPPYIFPGGGILFGYPVSLFLGIIALLAIPFVNEPSFMWTPFCLMSVIVGYVWGAGPRWPHGACVPGRQLHRHASL